MHRGEHALAQGRLDLGFRRLFTAEVLLEHLVVGFRHLLDQLLAVVLGLFHHVGRNLADDVVRAHRLVLVGDRLHLNEVDDTNEAIFRTDGELDGDGVGLELRDDLVEGALEVRTDAVHLVHEADARDAVLVRLAPHRFGLRLDTGNRVEHGHGTVENAQRALHFSGEVDVTRRVDDVDAVLAPEAGGGGRRDRDAALLLLLHPVHHGRAFVHFADLVRDARVEQDPFRRGRFTGINVRHDADVAGLRE